MTWDLRNTYPAEPIHIRTDADINLDELFFGLIVLTGMYLNDRRLVVGRGRMARIGGPPNGQIRRCPRRANNGILRTEQALDGFHEIAWRPLVSIIGGTGKDAAPVKRDEDVHIAMVLLARAFYRRRHADEELPQSRMAGRAHSLVDGQRHAGGVQGIGQQGKGGTAHDGNGRTETDNVFVDGLVGGMGCFTSRRDS